MNNTDFFIETVKLKITRPGIDKLMNYLSGTDFFSAPASTKYHLSEEGGLCQHSINVYNRLKSLSLLLPSPPSEDTMALCALFHDICKTNFYAKEMRNVKENGEWVQKPYYTVSDTLPYGHGEKSVYILSGFVKLSREEAMAIRWHMGAYEGASLNTLSDAYEQYPLALALHTADLWATYVDEKSPK